MDLTTDIIKIDKNSYRVIANDIDLASSNSFDRSEFHPAGNNSERLNHQRSQIKKLDPQFRKPRPSYKFETRFWRKILLRLAEDSQFLRSAVQGIFVLLCLWIGIEFWMFVRWGTSNGEAAYVAHPPGSEGFLPISSLMSLKHWLLGGEVNSVHPAGLFIFVAILLVGIVLKKAFCSWLCPIGTLSESLWMLGKKLFGRNLRPPRWLDYPLRSLKYLLAFFFVYTIWQMDLPSLQVFIESPYNKMADVKMFQFFSAITPFALWTIIILMVASIFIKNFWCRFLCPYGAFLGIASLVSPMKITRTESSCIDCSMCTKACPSNITIHTARKVWSDECTGCLACVDVCPVKDTLEMRTAFTQTRVPTWVFGMLVAGIFVGVTGLAMLTGHWSNEISREEYLRRFKSLDTPMYQHNRGHVPEYTPND